jgi:hypothetical protein
MKEIVYIEGSEVRCKNCVKWYFAGTGLTPAPTK